MNKKVPKFYIQKERILCSLFFSLFLIDWIAKYFQNTWLHNFVGMPFYYIGTDFSYWFLIMSGLPQFLLSTYRLSIIFDIILTGLTIWNIFAPRRITNVIWLLFYMVWVMTTNAAVGSHFHSYNGFIIMGFCFCFLYSSYFIAAWEMARFYIMYIFSSAALWKIIRGVAFDKDHLKILLFQLNIWHAQTEAWYAPIFKIYTSQLWISFLSMIMVILLQLFFLIGFVTKKYDKWLLFLFVFFCIANQVVFRHFFFELLILGLCLIFRPEKTRKLYHPVVI